MMGWFRIIAFGICLLSAEQARAADADADTPEARARALYDQGIAQYNLQRYDEAIKTFESAYSLSPYPGFLYNIAQSYRHEGRSHCADALHYYRAYLRAETEIPHREEIEQLAVQMETCVKDLERERAASAHPTSSRIPLGLGIAGGVLAAGGGSLLLWAASDYHDLKDACAPSCDPNRIDGPRLHERIGLGLAIGGGVSVAAALALWWHGRSESPPQSGLPLHAWLAPSSNGIALGGSF
jgi:tetratricopeptide (TPR) repeat protein